MTVEAWDSLPAEVRKILVEKRKAASLRYQGHLTYIDPALL
jgi:hypothetical protein